MKLGACEPIAALNRVKIAETGEPLVDIRDHCPAVQVVEACCPYLRGAVANMLNRAAASLPAGHVFRVGTALRTLAMQAGGWDSYFQRMKDEHPGWPLSALRRATNRYFAPYDQPAPPGHCTGGAVDVQLLGPDGEPLDVTSPTQGWEAAYTWSDRISPQARRNRMVLVDAMLGAGFSNCREEFWHYSYGDSAWAVRVGAATCPYGLVEPPESVEARFEGARAAAIVAAGEHRWRVDPEPSEEPGAPSLFVGIFWARQQPISLEVGAPVPPALFLSADRKEWTPLATRLAGFHLLAEVTPTAERVYVTDAPPPAVETA